MQYTIVHVTKHEIMFIHAHNANPPLNFFCSSEIYFKKEDVIQMVYI